MRVVLCILPLFVLLQVSLAQTLLNSNLDERYVFKRNSLISTYSDTTLGDAYRVESGVVFKVIGKCDRSGGGYSRSQSYYIIEFEVDDNASIQELLEYNYRSLYLLKKEQEGCSKLIRVYYGEKNELLFSIDRYSPDSDQGKISSGSCLMSDSVTVSSLIEFEEVIRSFNKQDYQLMSINNRKENRRLFCITEEELTFLL